MKTKAILFSLLGLCVGNVLAVDHAMHDHHHDHASYIDYSPVGVMGSHTHETGNMMFSYRFMNMQMDGMRDGTDDMTDAEVLQDFMVTPTRMTMQMHMFGAMYAPSDDLTMMLMVPLVRKDMDHITRMGARFTTRSDGLGDIKLSGIYVLKQQGHEQILFNAGISLPTGDIDEKDDTPAMANAILPYPMQLGSGSWDLLPGITYLNQNDAWSWGTQLTGTIRLNDNDNDYRLGNRLELSGWAAKTINASLSGSLRLKGLAWGDIDGKDSRLNPMMVPTADTDLQSGKRIDVLAGLNFHGNGVLKGHRFAIEAGVPVYENLDGPQMSTQWMLTAGWQYAL